MCNPLIAIMADSEEKLNSKEDLLREIGNRLTELRKLEGYSNHEDFAFDKGINRSQYGKYEKGKSDLQISTLIRIIHNYKDMTIAKFFEGVDIPDEFTQNVSKIKSKK